MRIKLLTRFFFNPLTRAYLRELAKEFNVSTNAVREELNQLTRTQLLTSEKNGRNIIYMANQAHPLFPELRSMATGRSWANCLRCMPPSLVTKSRTKPCGMEWFLI
jgi:hypothetical protein